MVVIVVLFAIRGFLRGSVAQVFVVIGVLTGLWVAGLVSQWVGDHWRGARPAAVFLALRWLVAALSGLALAAIFQWWGERLGKAVREGPLGWLDRGAGLVVGAVVGLIVCALLMLGALILPRPRDPAVAVAHMRLGPSTMTTAARVCAFGEPYLPTSGWLKERFLAARQRAGRMREPGATTHQGHS